MKNIQVTWVNSSDVGKFITSDIYIEVKKLLARISKDDRSGLVKAVLGVVVNEGNVLLIKKYVSDDTLNWQFPGGYIEEKETEKAAVAREIFEETGIRCQPINKIGERKHPISQSLIAYWLCEYTSGEIGIKETDKFSDVAWFDKSSAIKRLGDNLFSPVKELLEAN